MNDQQVMELYKVLAMEPNNFGRVLYNLYIY